MTKKILLFVMCISIAYVSASNNPTFSRVAFKKLFESAKPYADLSSAFYSVKGLELLNENLQGQALVVNSRSVSFLMFFNFYLSLKIRRTSALLSNRNWTKTVWNRFTLPHRS